MDQLQQLVEYMAAGLVDRPEEVHVDSRRRGPLAALHLRVAEDELGRVIGKGGRIAKSMRNSSHCEVGVSSGSAESASSSASSVWRDSIANSLSDMLDQARRWSPAHQPRGALSGDAAAASAGLERASAR